MNRKSLLETLDLVKPALADDNIIPIFQNFCFENGHVYANRDKLSIIAPCPEVQETFAINGRTFTDLLRAASSEETELQMVNENVVIKNGRSKIKMPFMDKSYFVFEEPEKETWDVMLDIAPSLLDAFKLCLITSAVDSTMPNFMGVTIKGSKHINLYSCDGDALSQFKLDAKSKNEIDHTLSNSFIEAILRVAEKTGCTTGQLYVNEGWAYAEFGNDFKVYGRNISKEEPFDFDGHLARVLKSNPTFVDIPESFESALTRARVVADQESKPTSIKIDDGKMELVTDTHIGVVRDTLKISNKHPNAEVTVAAKLINRAVSMCDTFAITENASIYQKGDDFTLLVANYSE